MVWLWALKHCYRGGLYSIGFSRLQRYGLFVLAIHQAWAYQGISEVTVVLQLIVLSATHRSSSSWWRWYLVRDSPIPTHPDSFRPPRMTPRPSRHTRTLALPSTVKTQSSATPPAPAPSSLQVPSHSMTPDPADPRDVARRHVVGELSVLSHKRWTLSVP